MCVCTGTPQLALCLTLNVTKDFWWFKAGGSYLGHSEQCLLLRDVHCGRCNPQSQFCAFLGTPALILAGSTQVWDVWLNKREVIFQACLLQGCREDQQRQLGAAQTWLL